jgi:hypothetical protein
MTLKKKERPLAVKVLKYTALFLLTVLETALGAKQKEHEPTWYEKTHGEKIPGSDKYFIPEDKLR